MTSMLNDAANRMAVRVFTWLYYEKAIAGCL
jgi:hypothetical protein